jgi:hypothetical protein
VTEILQRSPHATPEDIAAELHFDVDEVIQLLDALQGPRRDRYLARLQAIAAKHELIRVDCPACKTEKPIDTCPNCGGSGRLWENSSTSLDDQALERLGRSSGR